MTSAEVYALLHGHVRAFGQERVDTFRTKAEEHVRKLRGETGALSRWLAAHREQVEQNATWAEARSNMLTLKEAAAGLSALIKDALGTTTVEGNKEIDAPGYDITVRTRGVETKYVDRKEVLIMGLYFRTKADKPVYFKRVPTEEELLAAERSRKDYRSYMKSPKAERAGKDRLILSSLEIAFPIDTDAYAAGVYDAFATKEEQSEYSSRLWRGRRHPDTGRDLTKENTRIGVPALETGEATFTATFVHTPGKERSRYDDLTREVEGVTLETLADTISETTDIEFPSSPYSRG